MSNFIPGINKIGIRIHEANPPGRLPDQHVNAYALQVHDDVPLVQPSRQS